MEERLDILDTNGNPMGITSLKSKAHRFGLFHATVHIWLYTKTRELLIQLRTKNKATYPLLWDVSVAGHIGAGETSEAAAVREIQEEIGLTTAQDSLNKIGVFKSTQIHHDTLIDNEFHHTFICELTRPLGQLIKQESEVADLKLIPISEFEKEIFTSTLSESYVPHDGTYYQAILAAIKGRL